MGKNDSKAMTVPLPVEVVSTGHVPSAGEIDAIAHALSAPFEGTEVKFKPQHISGNRALVVPFVDARVIQDRLDDVMGVMGWQDSYQCLPDGAVVCRLQIRLGVEWITKEDVGGQSEQPDEGDRRKAAFSDALKRAAVKFGIGRYLYRLKPQWVDYDPQKRQLIGTPKLPSMVVPAAAARTREVAPIVVVVPPKKEGKAKPANGLELKRRLAEKDAQLAREGMCKPGELLQHVGAAGVKAGHGDDLTAWSEAAIDVAIAETRSFETAHRPVAQQVA